MLVMQESKFSLVSNVVDYKSLWIKLWFSTSGDYYETGKNTFIIMSIFSVFFFLEHFSLSRPLIMNQMKQPESEKLEGVTLSRAVDQKVENQNLNPNKICNRKQRISGRENPETCAAPSAVWGENLNPVGSFCFQPADEAEENHRLEETSRSFS